MLKQLTKTFRLTALCGAALLGGAGSANAAYVVINADPVFGGTVFPDLAWSAKGALYIPDACRDLIGGLSVLIAPYPVPVPVAIAGALNSSCGAARFEDVKLTLYDKNDVSMFQTIDLNYYLPDTLPIANRNEISQQLIDFSFANGQLTGFHTTLSLPRLGTLDVAGSGDYRFSLEFSSGTAARLVAFRDEGEDPSLYSFRNDNPVVSGFPAVIEINPIITDAEYRLLRTVPEPATLALVLAGLAGALGIGRAKGRARAA